MSSGCSVARNPGEGVPASDFATLLFHELVHYGKGRARDAPARAEDMSAARSMVEDAKAFMEALYAGRGSAAYYDFLLGQPANYTTLIPAADATARTPIMKRRSCLFKELHRKLTDASAAPGVETIGLTAGTALRVGNAIKKLFTASIYHMAYFHALKIRIDELVNLVVNHPNASGPVLTEEQKKYRNDILERIKNTQHIYVYDEDAHLGRVGPLADLIKLTDSLARSVPQVRVPESPMHWLVLYLVEMCRISYL